MGAALAGLLILSLMLTSSMMFWRVSLVGNDRMSTAQKQMIELKGEQARTILNITTAAGNRNNDTLSVSVKNDGATSVALTDFSKMEVIVIYDGATPAATRFTYTATDPPPAGQWTKTSISGAFEPDIWNPTENLTILATLGVPCVKGTVTIGYPNGVTDTNPFICAGQGLYFHSETTNINGTNYYQLKNIPADGAATTVTAGITGSLTGRFSPTPNGGKFVFPLTDVSHFPAANWDLTYRVKRDIKDFGGWFWFDDATGVPDISLASDTGGWQDIDLSILPCSCVPVGATGAIVEIVYAPTAPIVTGTHNGGNNNDDLIDTTTDFTAAGVSVGDMVINTTDRSHATITAINTTTNPNDTIVGNLANGNQDDWDSGDNYEIWKQGNGMVKGKEDTNTYNVPPTTPWQLIFPKNHRWQIVKVDSNRKIQGFISDPAVDFKLLGYTLGSDPSYFTTPIDITPPGIDRWSSVTVAQYVDADADGVILLVNNPANKDEDYGIGEVACDAGKDNLSPYGNTMWLVGINEFDQFKAQFEDTFKLYLVGQTKGSVVYYCLDIFTADPSPLNSWQLMDADDYGVAAAANGLIFRARGNRVVDKRGLGLRHGDNTTDNWNKEIATVTEEEDHHLQAAAGLNAANQWYEYKEHKDVLVFISAYTRRVQMDVHADIDVVIRQADGSIRLVGGNPYIVSHVAPTTPITTDTWQTQTITFAFPAYTVVLPTDYLEIDLFADVITNISTETVSLEFRIDDPSLAVADQMKVNEIVP